MGLAGLGWCGVLGLEVELGFDAQRGVINWVWGSLHPL